MKKKHTIALLVFALGMALLLPGIVLAHCDTLDGPVVGDARIALEKGDVTPALKWVNPADEAEIRRAFAQAVAVRTLGPQARELADRSFFETLVRVHRAGEGAHYTGLKPAGKVEPPIAKADQALEKGSVDELARTVARHAEEGIRERFVRTAELRNHAGENVVAGRRYVESYVDYVHYVEGVANAIHKGPVHGAPEGHGH